MTDEEYFTLVSVYIQHLKRFIIHRPKHFDHLAKNACGSNVAYIKELRIPACSTILTNLKVIQSNLNITDTSDSNCTNFKDPDRKQL